ncbi:unnamed protein product [Lactuca virosa]|uniref:Uncharacterized protein n=1 Tax=Lactuca virosa TaxID=75947 RepID=A0AAU9P288_9ASTR|nr:unnamed protein product [Lactuca virosa]
MAATKTGRRSSEQRRQPRIQRRFPDVRVSERWLLRWFGAPTKVVSDSKNSRDSGWLYLVDKAEIRKLKNPSFSPFLLAPLNNSDVFLRLRCVVNNYNTRSNDWRKLDDIAPDAIDLPFKLFVGRK